MPSNDFWGDLPDRQARLPDDQAGRPDREKKDPERLTKTKIKTDPIVSAPPRPSPPPPPTAPRFLLVALTLFLMAVGAASGLSFWLIESIHAAADGDPFGPVLVEIAPGQSTRTIALNLEEQGLIISRWPFLVYLGLKHLTIRAGTYSLSPTLKTKEIADLLADGQTSELKVTIPEGWRIEQMADLFDRLGIVDRADFLRAATFDPVRYTLPPGITRQPGETLEGLLFPDTYRFAYGVTSKEIVEKMLVNFVSRTGQLGPNYDQIILASIIEREAKFDDDRPKMAGVYQNRLANNIRLEADPTIQYAKDTLAEKASDQSETITWWQPLTTTDYQSVASPYNTYRTLGLPPTPIANPGLKSLEAAVHPTKHDFFYFFNLQDGSTVYSKTIDEHNLNKAKYGL